MNLPVNTNFAEQVKAIPGAEKLMMCFSCGTCTSKCMIQEKLEPNYNPRRLIRETVFNFEETAFTDETTWLCTACDLCYPACPQKIHISAVITAVKQLAFEQGRQNPNQTAKVVEATCVACGLCESVCPYQAIKLVEKKVPFRGMITVASVDQGKCMACGMCTAACRSDSIRLNQDFNDNEILGSLWGWLESEAA
ncbi:MAG: 4Fe-4S dicluster domain-containing protein [Anaerolineaceae bacterium]|jgi:heterodisulfide reductase subunit C